MKSFIFFNILENSATQNRRNRSCCPSMIRCINACQLDLNTLVDHSSNSSLTASHTLSTTSTQPLPPAKRRLSRVTNNTTFTTTTNSTNIKFTNSTPHSKLPNATTTTTVMGVILKNQPLKMAAAHFSQGNSSADFFASIFAYVKYCVLCVLAYLKELNFRSLIPLFIS